MAAPGRMAWPMASPIRLRRRSIEEHADRRRAERQGEAADQRPAHEGEFDEGIDEGVDHAEIPLRRSRARKFRHARPRPR